MLISKKKILFYYIYKKNSFNSNEKQKFKHYPYLDAEKKSNGILENLPKGDPLCKPKQYRLIVHLVSLFSILSHFNPFIIFLL
jgi:hypothetical protein